MKDCVELEPVRFSWKRKWVRFWLLAYIMFFVLLFADNDVWDWLKKILSWNINNIFEKYWIILFVILFVIISLIYYIFSYVANSKSYIELTGTHMIMDKPIRYPFSSMETIYIPYEEIETVKIMPMSSWNTIGFLWYKVIITKKEEFWKAEIIKFYWLENAKKLDEELKKRWVNSCYSSSWWNVPPSA